MTDRIFYGALGAMMALSLAGFIVSTMGEAAGYLTHAQAFAAHFWSSFAALCGGGILFLAMLIGMATDKW